MVSTPSSTLTHYLLIKKSLTDKILQPLSRNKIIIILNLFSIIHFQNMERMKMYWLAVCLMLACAEASKILVVFPLPSRSHGNLGDGVVKHLLNAGHEVSRH